MTERTRLIAARAVPDQVMLVPSYVTATREGMTREMMRCGPIIWPSVVESPEYRDEEKMTTYWISRFEVAHG